MCGGVRAVRAPGVCSPLPFSQIKCFNGPVLFIFFKALGLALKGTALGYVLKKKKSR